MAEKPMAVIVRPDTVDEKTQREFDALARTIWAVLRRLEAKGQFPPQDDPQTTKAA